MKSRTTYENNHNLSCDYDELNADEPEVSMYALKNIEAIIEAPAALKVSKFTEKTSLA